MYSKISRRINMKKILLFSLLVGLGSACSRESIPLYDSPHHVQFVNEYTDSMEISFFFYGSAQEIKIALPVKLVGMPLTEAKEVVLKANSQYTTAAPSLFALPEKALFKAGQTLDTLYITLKREGLNQKVRLVVDIENGMEILSGQSIYSRQIIWFSTEISRPAWWDSDVEEVFLGRYSIPKFQKLIDVTGVGDWDGKIYDERRALALEFKRELLRLRYAGTPYPDEELGLDDMSLDVPVLGY